MLTGFFKTNGGSDPDLTPFGKGHWWGTPRSSLKFNKVQEDRKGKPDKRSMVGQPPELESWVHELMQKVSGEPLIWQLEVQTRLKKAKKSQQTPDNFEQNSTFNFLLLHHPGSGISTAAWVSSWDACHYHSFCLCISIYISLYVFVFISVFMSLSFSLSFYQSLSLYS